MLLHGLVSAGPYPYIALYLDENRSCYCADGPGQFTVYVFVLPSDNGASGSAFMVETDINGFRGSMTKNSIVDFKLCCEDCYIYINCMIDWHWVVSLTVYLNDGSTPGTVYVVESQSMNFLGTSSCVEGSPKENATILTNIYFNTNPCPEIGNENTSWGAIKSMFE